MLARTLVFAFIPFILSFAQANSQVRVLLHTIKDSSKVYYSDLFVNKSKVEGAGELSLIKGKWGWWIKGAQIKIHCDEGQALELSGNLNFLKFNQLKKITLNCFSDSLAVVLPVDMNDYLLGVLSGEMPSLWNEEALKAQAVTSRTYTLWKMKINRDKHYDVQATVADQVFSAEKILNPVLVSKIKKIILKTQSEYLIDKTGQLTKAYFHADCGGETTTAEQVWGHKESDHFKTTDVSCQKRKSNHWQSDWSIESLDRLIKSRVIIPESWRLEKIKLHREINSSRVEVVDLFFGEGQFKRISSDQLRSILGYSQLKSTKFEMKYENGIYKFAGKGHGHGVGLCQWGSKALADKGFDYQQILKHYFPYSYVAGNHKLL